MFTDVYTYSYIQSISSSVSHIIIPNWTCNEMDYTTFDFSRFTIVESIEIGNDCFRSVKTFKIDGLDRLKTLKIGNNSFTQKRQDWGDDESKSFQILNCESLESIQIGQFSFFDYAGSFFLSNLPSLQLIDIGLNDYPSANFVRSSFVVRGIFYSF